LGIIPPFSKAGLEMASPLSGVGKGEGKAVGVGKGVGDAGVMAGEAKGEAGKGVGLAGWHERAKSAIITKRRLFFPMFTSLLKERAFWPLA
jgi:hypothetical protein